MMSKKLIIVSEMTKRKHYRRLVWRSDWRGEECSGVFFRNSQRRWRRNVLQQSVPQPPGIKRRSEKPLVLLSVRY